MKKTLALAVAILATTPVHAQMAVFDGASVGQLIQQVAQSAQQLAALKTQIQQQIAMLQSIGSDASPIFALANQDAAAVLKAAQGLGFLDPNISQTFSTIYPGTSAALNAAGLSAALTQWRTLTRTALSDSLVAEASVARNQTSSAGAVSSAVAASQAAAGATSAIQAENQILAGLSSQLAQLQTVMIAAQRAHEMEAAERQSVIIAAPTESARVLAPATATPRVQLDGHL